MRLWQQTQFSCCIDDVNPEIVYVHCLFIQNRYPYSKLLIDPLSAMMSIYLDHERLLTYFVSTPVSTHPFGEAPNISGLFFYIELNVQIYVSFCDTVILYKLFVVVNINIFRGDL